MAYLNITRVILATIKAAEHSISASAIAYQTDLTESASVMPVIIELLAAGIIKENSAAPGTYFTRTPHREAIQAFIDRETTTLPSMTWDDPTANLTPATTPTTTTATGLTYKGIPVDDILATLKSIVASPHALNVNRMPATQVDDEGFGEMIQMLVTADLIKEHAEYPDCYFTRTPKRGLITRFLNGDITIEELMGDEPVDSKLEEEPASTTHSTPHTDYEYSITAAPIPQASAVTTTQAQLDLLVSALQTVRDLSNALLTAVGR